MRRKKQQRLKEEAFWAKLLYCSGYDNLDEMPHHLDWVKFRRVGVDDEGLSLMVTQVKSINMLDLDGCGITAY